MFRGRVEDCFELPGKGLAVMLTEVEGIPQTGTIVEFLGGHRAIVDVHRNKEGQAIFTPACLPGQKVAPHCTILLEWNSNVPAPTSIRGAPVEEIKLL